ncbi:MAG TPA: zf-HC2 domain-containing protein [Pyrinomonadaceae bacterium]
MKETWDNKIAASTEICARAEDLVAYLYGEATRGDARDFEKHMEQCASCRTEIKAFGNVREAVTEWRQAALGTIRSQAFETNVALIAEPKKAGVSRKLSAFAAIREFFTLSPMWMRAATAVVAIVFCALAAITVAYFKQQPKTVVVEKKTGYSEQELNERVAEAIKKLNDNKAVEKSTPSPQEIKIAQNQGKQNAQPARNNPQVAVNKVRRQLTPHRATEPSTELVRADDYLPFTASKDEEKLPSLSDLVSDDN